MSIPSYKMQALSLLKAGDFIKRTRSLSNDEVYAAAIMVLLCLFGSPRTIIWASELFMASQGSIRGKLVFMCRLGEECSNWLTSYLTSEDSLKISFDILKPPSILRAAHIFGADSEIQFPQSGYFVINGKGSKNRPLKRSRGTALTCWPMSPRCGLLKMFTCPSWPKGNV